MKKTLISISVSAVLGTTSFNASAISNGDTMTIDAGGSIVTSCLLGTALPCSNPLFEVTSQIGSYFIMGGSTTNLSGNQGIVLGTTQLATGSHGGSVNGTENPSIDNPWLFSGNTGMHQSTSPITVISNTQLDMTGWSMLWNSIEDISMGGCFLVPNGCFSGSLVNTGIADIVITGDTYVLDYFANIQNADPSSLGGVAYTLHLEGAIIPGVPIPAAIWLFGSGLIGLIGLTRPNLLTKHVRRI